MLELEHLIAGYVQPVAGPLDRSFRDGECVMLRGSNGSGKTTLMKTLAGLLPPLGGAFRVNGKTVMVPTRINKVKGFTVSEFIATSIDSAYSGARGRDALGRALALLKLEHIRDCDISRVSDGEFQKACIATAFTRDCSVMLLDEPTAFLDVENRIMVLSTLKEIASATGTTILFSTHDIHDGALYSDSVIDLGRGL
ncbi:MAG: ABC transporter ATP-binding protein [Candidatus Cryptobacteroides sp.]